MQLTTSTKCLMCNRLTLSPDRLCVYHQNTSSTSSSRHGPMPNGPQTSTGSNLSQIRREVALAFPEVDPNSVESLRSKSSEIIRGAVSLEALRRFPDTNVDDYDTRRQMLESHFNQIREEARLSDVNLRPQEVQGLMHSSIDEYGSGMEESMGAASYALNAEWKIAQATQRERDQFGVSYRQPLPTYLAEQQGYLDQTVMDEYRRQMVNYAAIIRNETGGPPVNIAPVIMPQRTQMSEQMMEAASRADERNEKAREATQDAPKQDENVGLNIAKKAAVGLAKGIGRTLWTVVDDSIADASTQARLTREDIRRSNAAPSMTLRERHRKMEDDFLRHEAIKRASRRRR